MLLDGATGALVLVPVLVTVVGPREVLALLVIVLLEFPEALPATRVSTGMFLVKCEKNGSVVMQAAEEWARV